MHSSSIEACIVFSSVCCCQSPVFKIRDSSGGFGFADRIRIFVPTSTLDTIEWKQILGKGQTNFEIVWFSSKHYSENDVAGFDYVPDAGTYCVSMFLVNGTYKAGRAIILNVLENGFFHVLYIDFGNEEIVPTARIRPLIKRFASVPWLVVHCNLSKVVPPNGQTSWTQQNKDFFSKLISEEGIETQMMVKECCRREENANGGVTYEVELFQLWGGYFDSVADIMDRNGEAVFLQ